MHIKTAVALLATITCTALGACSGDTNSSSGQQARNATANSTTMPVYTVASSGLTQTQLDSINKALTAALPNGSTLKLAADGTATFLNPTGMLGPTKRVTVPAATKTTDDEPQKPSTAAIWDKTALDKVTPLSASQLTTLLTTAARTITPGDAGVQVITGPITLEIANPKTGTSTLKRQIGTTAGRTSLLGSLPLIGPGNTFDLAAGPDGKLTSATISVRTYRQGTPVTVAVGTSATDRCQQALTTTNPNTATGLTLSSRLVYLAPALSQKVTTLEPVIECASTLTSGIQSAKFFVPARTDVAPKLIVLPIPASKVLREGDFLGLELGTAYVGNNANGPLPGTGPNTTNLENWFVPWGMTQKIDLNDTAPKAQFSTNANTTGVDTVDFFWYSGHANGQLLQGTNGNIFISDMKYGDGDLEWFASSACGPLQETFAGQNWATRLAPAFNGLHLFMGYATTSYDTTQEGETLGRVATGQILPGILTLPKVPLAAAWQVMATAAQPPQVQWAVVGAQSATNGTAADCLNCSTADISPTDAGFELWRISGNS